MYLKAIVSICFKINLVHISSLVVLSLVWIVVYDLLFNKTGILALLNDQEGIVSLNLLETI